MRFLNKSELISSTHRHTFYCLEIQFLPFGTIKPSGLTSLLLDPQCSSASLYFKTSQLSRYTLRGSAHWNAQNCSELIITQTWRPVLCHVAMLTYTNISRWLETTRTNAQLKPDDDLFFFPTLISYRLIHICPLGCLYPLCARKWFLVPLVLFVCEGQYFWIHILLVISKLNPRHAPTTS